MFQKKQLSVLDWFGFHILMIIPLANIIIFLILLFSGETNKTLRNYLWFQVFAVTVFIILYILFLSQLPAIMALLENYMNGLPG
ncbi:MAG: hypothetical protein CVV57_08025 [Tenericutes bacterium HGW-Tenericutes-2]|jgi:hypothetical protein|nr:MAG: hypothetical protein CVV57_08025 [Tenericutes bacterium HGW-Tenericutes-2]